MTRAVEAFVARYLKQRNSKTFMEDNAMMDSIESKCIEENQFHLNNFKKDLKGMNA